MPKVNYRKLAKEDTFFGRYLRLCSNGEQPYAYDFWTGAWLLSSVLGKSIVVDRPGAPVYTNMYVILVAESGVTRKSTSVRRAMGMYREYRAQQQGPRIVESRITQELLEYQMSQDAIEHGYSQAIICIDELVKFLGREKYVSNMPTFLTDVYDCPAIRVGGGTLARGGSVLKDVFVSFLSASTPSWLIRAVNPDVIEGGFTSRVVFVVEEAPKKSSPWPEPEDKQLRAEVVQQLRDIAEQAKKYQRITISDGAKKKFAGWYKSRRVFRDAFRASYQSREDGHILRLAALLSISDGTWEIQIPHLTTAIAVVTECRENGASIFEGTGSNSDAILGIDKLRDKLMAAGMNGATQTELVQAVQRFMNAREAKAALDIMHELGMVQQFTGIKLGRGRPTTIWRGTRLLLNPGAVDAIAQEYST